MTKVRTRFAPSPTGFLHIGGLRTALYEYAFAKSQQGKFILRIEDTDRRRFVPGATEKLYEMLKLFKLNWDEGPLVGGPYSPYIQSERASLGIYQKYADQLLAENHAYYCFCATAGLEKIEKVHKQKKSIMRDPCRNLDLKESQKRIKKGEKAAIRLQIPDKGQVGFYDFIRQKQISWQTKDIDEVTLLKSDGFPTYHLAVVVDDALMRISHILRAHEWLPSTPVHLLLFQYLNFPVPQIGHFTVILDPKGGKLSKRKGSVACEEFLAEGYLPEAILNFVMLLGWAPKDNRELFTLDEFVNSFQKGDLQTANPIFNRGKLDWFNGVYIRKTQNSNLKTQIHKFYQKKYPRELIEKTIPLVKTRINKLSDYWSLCSFFFEEPELNGSLFNREKDFLYLKKSLISLISLKSWRKEKIEKVLHDLIIKEGWQTGDFFMAFRLALTGNRITPPITDSAAILGQETTLVRLKKSIKLLGS